MRGRDPTDPTFNPTRARRRASAALVLAGTLDLASAITPPLEHRLRYLLEIVPLAVPQVATALVVLAGLGLLVLARGVRRGQRPAFRFALALLGASAVLHIVKGVDLEEAAAAALVAGYLLAHRRAFRAPADGASRRRGIVALGTGGVAALAAGTATVEVVHRHGLRPPLGRALAALAERLVLIRSIPLPHRLDDFLTPAIGAAGLGLLTFAAAAAVRPIAWRPVTRDVERARDVVRADGSGTLDYFALRDDKDFFFHGRSLVAYGVYGGVCLVSPEPIGPDAERAAVWRAFRQHVDEHGWALAVLGAGERWLPLYRASGMRTLYVGDEAVVDLAAFRLDGGARKGLRQAVGRVRRHGYTVTFHDPAAIGADLAGDLRAVMASGRRGDVERGFSMTLGRVFSPADDGLLLAVCRDRDGRPVAFCQFVPAPGLGGYSLDLMRRDGGDHPNGLLDACLVATIEHLRAAGQRNLGLNFATMRAVLAGDRGDGAGARFQRWAALRLSPSMQIESLWRFNAKYEPWWLPRYAVYDAPEHMLEAALAVARAESFWELPLIGRFFTPADHAA